MRSRIALLMILPTLILATGCASLYESAGRSVASQILLAPGPVRMSREYTDLYACANEQPLICECLGRFSASSSCECRCPIAP